MRHRATTILAALVVCGGLLGACTGNAGDDGAERRTPAPMTNAPEGQEARPRPAGSPADTDEAAAGQAGTSGDAAEMARADQGYRLEVGQTVEVTGCVGTAPGTKQFALRDVRYSPPKPLNPQRSTTETGPFGLTQGSWVRLEGNGQEAQIRQLAGQHVRVTGTILDTGASTIGTAGEKGEQPAQSGSPDARDEHYSNRVKEKAGSAAHESLANSTAALVRVTGIEKTGEPCAADLVR